MLITVFKIFINKLIKHSPKSLYKFIYNKGIETSICTFTNREWNVWRRETSVIWWIDEFSTSYNSKRHPQNFGAFFISFNKYNVDIFHRRGLFDRTLHFASYMTGVRLACWGNILAYHCVLWFYLWTILF